MFRKDYILPKKILRCERTEGEEHLLSSKTQMAAFACGCPCKIQPGGWILLDFGLEYNGGVQIICQDMMGKKNARLRIRFGESAMECMSDIGYKGATNDHSVRDQVLLAPWVGILEYGHTGYRFIRIDNCDEVTVSFMQIYGVYEHSGKDILGTFHSSDERLNRIWDVGVRTVYLNNNDLITDGIKRDRLVWIGDIHPEMLSLSTLYGRFAPIEKSLDFIKRQTPLPAWMNNIPTYSMWWMIILHDYYLRTGCMDYLAEQKEYLLGLLKQIDENISPEGEILYTGYLLDWPTHEQPDEIPGVRALNVLAVQKAAKILAFLKEDCDLPEKILAKLAQKRYPVADKKQVKAFECLAYGEHTPETLRFLTQGGVKGFSTFMIYYILKSIVLCGGEDESVELLKKYYGGMLAMGATTFWEDFDIDWTENATKITELPKRNKKDIHGDYGRYCYVGFRHSFCHGWASGPIGYLSECVAGFNATEPGKLTIHPHLGTLRYVKAKFPTPYGVVEVYHEKENGKTVTACRAPREVAVTFEGCEVTEFRQY